MAKRTLIIGGTRFIGAHVARRLHDGGAEVVLFHRGLSTNPVLPEVEHVLDPLAAYPITAFPAHLRRDWDIVIHMTAMGEADAHAAIQAFAGRVGRLVLVSSCDVYRAYGRLVRTEPGEPEPTPLDEGAPLRSVLYPYRGMEEQLGPFARDYEKILAEAEVRGAADLDWTILRLAKAYGVEDNADLATVYGFASQPAWRWTHGHVANIAAAIATAAIHPLARNKIFNVGEAHTPTMAERLAVLPMIGGRAPEAPDFDYRQPLAIDTRKIRECLDHADPIDERQAMQALARKRAAAQAAVD